MSSPSRPPDEETRDKLKKLNDNMKEHELVEESTIEYNGHDVDIIVDEKHVDVLKEEIQEQYTELAILRIPYISADKCRITVGYAGRL